MPVNPYTGEFYNQLTDRTPAGVCRYNQRENLESGVYGYGHWNFLKARGLNPKSFRLPNLDGFTKGTPITYSNPDATAEAADILSVAREALFQSNTIIDYGATEAENADIDDLVNARKTSIQLGSGCNPFPRAGIVAQLFTQRIERWIGHSEQGDSENTYKKVEGNGTTTWQSSSSGCFQSGTEYRGSQEYTLDTTTNEWVNSDGDNPPESRKVYRKGDDWNSDFCHPVPSPDDWLSASLPNNDGHVGVTYSKPFTGAEMEAQALINLQNQFDAFTKTESLENGLYRDGLFHVAKFDGRHRFMQFSRDTGNDLAKGDNPASFELSDKRNFARLRLVPYVLKMPGTYRIRMWAFKRTISAATLDDNYTYGPWTIFEILNVVLGNESSLDLAIGNPYDVILPNGFEYRIGNFRPLYGNPPDLGANETRYRLYSVEKITGPQKSNTP